MTAIHIMLDLETWGTRPGCDIRSIGACVFDPHCGYVAIPSGDENNDAKSFYVATDNPLRDTYRSFVGGNIGWLEHVHTGPQFSDTYPLHRDAKTVKWWNEQSAEAQAAFANPVDLRDACIRFAVWLESLHTGPIAPRYPDAINSDLRIWANDPQFDVSILSEVFHAVGLPVPWHYRAPRSLRTIAEAAGMTRDDFAAFNFGTTHNALDDAIAQAGIVCEAYKRLNLTKQEN